jgi:hypothetical protein
MPAGRWFCSVRADSSRSARHLQTKVADGSKQTVNQTTGDKSNGDQRSNSTGSENQEDTDYGYPR